ncbi:rhodanese-like domain-containing protein [Aestuariibacter salexigens]|uniref:rhodanese-like domain-containing protein n=1 Tax=Aestuariibacter salexigens TaxID=226010 RepID=UPI0004190B91|nr:rhodanese-like domain-containing protein [Aestuariibacter salexigens]
MKRLFISLLSIVSVWASASGVPDITAQQLLAQDANDRLILDVRGPDEYAQGHVPGAINIPHTEIAERLDEILSHKDKQVVVYCRSGYRAGKAIDVLLENNFSQVQHLEGDMLKWQEAELPLEK